MDNNESNLKPQQTGGLKLMTVFVVVLALHVIVIGGMTTYYLLKGGNSDDMLTDKASKSTKTAADGTLASDGQMPDSNDKSPASSTTTAETSGSAPSLTPPADQTSAPDASVTSTAPAVAPTIAPPVPPSMTPTGPVTTPGTPPPVAFHMGQTGPVINPPAELAPKTPSPVASTAETPAPTTILAPADSNVYVVKAHDSLAKIAHLNHIGVAKLKAANSLNSDLLQIGQKLVIPARAQTAVAATAPGIPANTVISSEPALTVKTPAPSATTVAKTTIGTAPDLEGSAPTTLQHHVYTVVKGDTLTKIAHKFKTTPTAIMAANNLTDPTKLAIGKKLKIPSKESRSATNSVPVSAPVVPPQPAQVQAQPSAPTGQLANFLQ